MLDVNFAHFLQIVVIACDPRYNLIHIVMRLPQIDGQGSGRCAVVDYLDSDDAVCVFECTDSHGCVGAGGFDALCVRTHKLAEGSQRPEPLGRDDLVVDKIDHSGIGS